MTTTDDTTTDRRAPFRPGPGRRRALLFVLGLVVTLVVLESAARELGPRGTTRVVLEQHEASLAAQDGRTATVVVGDSSVGAAVDGARLAEATGDLTYNMWLPNATATTTAALLTDFVGVNEATERAVIGITPRMFNETVRPDRERRLAQLETSLPWESRTDPGIYTRLERWASERLALVRYRSALRRPSDWIVTLRSDGDLELLAEGQVTYFFELTVDDIRPDYESGERAALADYEVSTVELDRLVELVDRLQVDGVDVFLLLLPTYDELYDEFLPNGSADREAFRRDFAAALDGRSVTIVDTTDLGADPALFGDGNHLNRAGSEALTERLVEAISGVES